MNRLLSVAAGALLLTTSAAAEPAALRTQATYHSDRLYEGESGTWDLVLSPGTTYTYRGTCDVYCHDLDFAVSGWVPPYNGRRGYWKFVASDRRPDDTPGISVTPNYRTTFRLTVIMSSCNTEPCRYDVGLSW